MAKHSYDKEFREGVIQYCLEHPDESYVSISKRFGVHDTTISGWIVKSQILHNHLKPKTAKYNNLKGMTSTVTNRISHTLFYI